MTLWGECETAAEAEWWQFGMFSIDFIYLISDATLNELG